MTNKFNLVIAEKDQQAENISEALGLSEKTYDILVPSKEFAKLRQKLVNPKKLLQKHQSLLKEMEEEYQRKGKIGEILSVKKYTSIQEKIEKYKNKVTEIEDELASFPNGEKAQQMRFWEGDYNGKAIILMACTGHLLGITLTTKNQDMHEEVEDESEESENKDSDNEESEDDSESESNTDLNDLNFYTKIKPPSPFKEAEVNKWLKLKLIEHFVKERSDEINQIICATDFDREGQLIFGLVMEYFNVDLTNCLRMKFSTLEEDVIRESYDNLIEFDIDLYDAGKMRQWSDYVIGFNLNPIVASLYREIVIKYLQDQNIEDKVIKRVKSAVGFNMGRVKLVILKYIYDKTNEHIENASEFGEEKMEDEEDINYNMSIEDDPQKSNISLISNTQFIIKHFIDKGYDLTYPNTLDFNAKITNLVNREVESNLDKDEIVIPSFLNLTKVFQICSTLGASTEEINIVLEYLYLQKYISYPRSKSEKWEKEDDQVRKDYSDSVLDMLDDLGYPIKNCYHDWCGNENDDGETHSHPCIHPLPSVTPEMIELLKKMNPLAHLVFNEIAIHTLKCFEKLPIIKQQVISYDIIDNKKNEIILNASTTKKLTIVKANILTFDGYDSYWDFHPEAQLTIDKLYKINIDKDIRKKISVDSIREKPEFMTDFDVVNFLNENDIGTDATRPVLMKNLIQKQYIVSDKVLLTTFLGNQMNMIAEHYVKFIDIDYTLEMEKDLNAIENGEMDKQDFMDEVKNLLIETCNEMKNNPDYFNEIFEEYPECEEHDIKMVLSNGKFGKFMVCPHFYSDGCKQKFSI